VVELPYIKETIVKKNVLVLVFVAVVCALVYGQNEPSSEQIRRYADSLGVSYIALRQLVDSSRIATQTGLSNPSANGAMVLSVRELYFMKDSDMLRVGAYYIVHAQFSGQSGRRVVLSEGPIHARHLLGGDAGFLVNVPERSNVTALITVRNDFLDRPRQLLFVEIVRR